MSVYAWRRLSLLGALACLALLWAQPTGAFDFAQTGARDVSAAVVTDATAYNAISGGSCMSISTALGGQCTFTISNLATTGQNYTVTRSSGALYVSSYSLTDAGSVNSGGVTTPSEIAVGGSTTLTAILNPCACAGAPIEVHWEIDGSQAFVLDSERTKFKMTIQYV